MNLRVISVISISVFSLFSCKKKEKEEEKEKSKNDIYIVGVDTTGAVFWKNDTLNDCPGCALGLIQDWKANGIVVEQGDFYIPNTTGYLKNSVQVNLPYATGIHDIAVSGDNVYAIGWSDTFNFGTFYWKNDKLIKLPGVQFAYPPLFVAVSGDDFYMTGRMPDSSGYWKNNTFVPFFYKGSITGIAVNGTDVYIMGSDTKGNRGYWKNGIFQSLYDTKGLLTNAIITDVYFDGDDVYVTGDGLSSNPPLYWKNNQPVGENTPWVSPRSIMINNNDIYIVCNSSSFGDPQSSDILLWKNGVLDTFARNAAANKIIIVK